MTSKDKKVVSIIVRINKVVQNLSRVSFYHKLRYDNTQVDQLANEATSLTQWVMIKDRGHCYKRQGTLFSSYTLRLISTWNCPYFKALESIHHQLIFYMRRLTITFHCNFKFYCTFCFLYIYIYTPRRASLRIIKSCLIYCILCKGGFPLEVVCNY